MAYVSEAQYGIDASFVSEVPEYLTCAVCQLVLRNPLQISQCGHKFCTPCFDKLKNYANNTKTELVCPVDQKTVDLSLVFEDKSVAMVISGLRVKCTCSDAGCTWVGELSDLILHEKKCGYKEKTTSKNNETEVIGREEVMSLFKSINNRMDYYNDALQDKEKDIAHLKHSIQEMETRFNQEMDKNKYLEEKLKQDEKDMKQYETKLENLNLKNVLLQQKLEVLENNFSKANRQLEENGATVIELKNEVQGLSIGYQDILELEKEAKNVKQHSLDMTVLKNELMETKASQKKTTSELKDLKTVTLRTEIGKLRSSFNTSSNKQYDKINKLTKRVDTFTEDLKTPRQCPQQASIADLKASLTNIENLIFCDYSKGSKDIVLRWKIPSYKHHADAGLLLRSPVFDIQWKQHRFQLLLAWKDETGALGLFLKIYRADIYATSEELKSFDVPFSFELTDKEGKILSETINLEMIDKARASYTIPPQELCAPHGHGFPSLVEKYKIPNYVINDSLLVICRLKPS